MPWFDLITGGLLGEQNPYDAIGNWSNETQRRNRQAVGLDANGNPLPTGLDANGNPVAPTAPDANQAAGAVTGAALANSQQQPGQQPQSTKTDPSLGALLMNLTQYQQREQGFNQALGAGFGAISQPRDREWVSKIFNVNEPDPMKIGQQEQDLASQQKGQDRMNSLGALIAGPQGDAIASSLNISKADLIARYRADPQGIGQMIQNFRQPTDQMKNLQQINTYAPQVQSVPGSNASDLQSLKNQILAGVAGPDAARMIADQINYRQTHNGQDPPWKDNFQRYNQYTADQKKISDNQADAGANLSAGVNKTEMLRQKLSDLQYNSGLDKILSASNDSPMKQAAWNALNDPDPNWQKNVAYAVLVNDPQALQAISELKEINGQEYTGAIDSLLGHGLRPSQTEVGAVREGFGQTKNINLFGSMKDYTAQAINPLLTRLDEAEATGYASAGELKSIPKKLQPFVHPTYLTGGKMHLDDGAAPEPWESQVNRPMPSDLEAAARAKIAQQPGNAFAIRDGLRRKGYVVDF
jgi:hypothetical protein